MAGVLGLLALAMPTQYRTHGVVRTNQGGTRGNVVEQVRAVASVPPACLWLVRLFSAFFFL